MGDKEETSQRVAYDSLIASSVLSSAMGESGVDRRRSPLVFGGNGGARHFARRPPSFLRKKATATARRGAKNANGAERTCQAIFFSSQIFVFKFIQNPFSFEREQSANSLVFKNSSSYPFVLFLSHCYKITFGLKKMVNFFSAQNEIYFDFFPPINPTFENFSLILLLLITKNQENHVNYDYDSNRFSVQTWRKKRDRKREKNQKI